MPRFVMARAPIASLMFACLVIVVTSLSGIRRAQASVAEPISPSPTRLLAILGWTPETLALAELSPSDLEAFRAALRTNATELPALDNARRELKVTLTKPDLATPTAAEGSLSLSQLETRLSAIRAQLCVSLPAAASDVLGNWIATSAYDLDSKYRILTLSPADWKSLEAALAAKRSCAKSGDALPAETAVLLNQYDTLDTVVRAAQALATRTPAIRTAFR
ncbi:MAG: hypothetical protein U0570_08560 [Phycisphaerales bacterium]